MTPMPQRSRGRRRPALARETNSLAWALALPLFLGACAVGPDYQRPVVALPKSVEGEQAGAPSAGPAADQAVPLEADWWKRFGSPKLNRWVELALTRNPGIDSGQAALRAALEGVRAQTGAYYPQIGVSYGFLRQQTQSQLASPLSNNDYIFNLHTAQLSLSYTPDVFGLNRRAVESLQAAANSQAGRPNAPARCATAVSTAITRSSPMIRFAVSVQSVSLSDTSCRPAARSNAGLCAAGGPSCNDTKLHPGTVNSGSISCNRIERRLSIATACGCSVRDRPAQTRPIFSPGSVSRKSVHPAALAHR